MLIADSPYPYRNLHTHVRRVYDAFGPLRMMWGSDLSRLRGTYGEGQAPRKSYTDPQRDE